MTDATTNLLDQGVNHHSAGDLSQAEAAYRRVIEAEPQNAQAFHMLGLLAFQTGRADMALASMARAVELHPAGAEIHANFALILAQEGRHAEAQAHYREAIRLHPQFAQAYYNLANLERDLGLHSDAEAGYRQAIACHPGYADAFYNLGLLLLSQEREAEATFREVLRLQPSHAGAHNALGMAAAKTGDAKKAEDGYREALRHAPLYPEAQNNLGNLMLHAAKPREAAVHFRQAVALKPDFAEAHAGLGMALLAQGQWEEGWREYEGRLGMPHYLEAFLATSRPLWRGEPPDGKHLLLYAEQGLGDTIQFCRYAPLLAARARVTVKVPASLVRLLLSLPGVEVVGREEKDAFDMHCPLMSLPFMFGTRLETIPAAVPYLRAPPDRIRYWKGKLESCAGKKVGLAWAGNPRLATDSRRSIAPEYFNSWAALPGVSFISLQKDYTGKPAILKHDWTHELSDLAETAALIENLDLVISVDSAVAHLAGALGKPVWLLNRFDSDWRWLEGRDDSPWYPTLYQFRQNRPGDWSGVLAQAGEALDRYLA